MVNPFLRGWAMLDAHWMNKGSGAARPQNELWSAPTELPPAQPVVPRFDANLLPENLRPWVLDIAHRMQCPVDFVAVGAIVAASSLIGARVTMQPKERDDWRVTPNLWGLIIGRSGVMKSPALSAALKPLRDLEKAEYKRWQAAYKTWQDEAKMAALLHLENEKAAKELANKDPDAARALLQQSEATPEPSLRRLIVNDSTVEKLGELMRVSTWGMLSYRDELHGLLTAMDKPGQEGARAFYLQAYDGDKEYTFDRIGRGTHRIDCVCLSVLGCMQPGLLREYVRGTVSGGSTDDGLLQRFALAVWPDLSDEFLNVDEIPDEPAMKRAWSVYQRLVNLPPPDANDAGWRFTVEAQQRFNEWRVQFEEDMLRHAVAPALESHLAKYRKLVPALALIFAMIDTPENHQYVGIKELERALAWSTYLRSHAERLYAATTLSDLTGADLLLKKVKALQLGGQFTPREVVKKGWTGLASNDSVRKAIEVLIEHGWLRREVHKAAGRPSESYLVHPLILAEGGG
ncbi:YfjI family protein [Pseudoduganella violaceinigra]|uniref:YfjI family protein n=1 Tax=Pseudoduganella violaceinigra TaxID=246602 RepID=UPI000413D9A1|nr:YfjI family protein [Pseudoduganella violaceinigra]